MVKEFKSVQDAENYIAVIKDTINKLIDVEMYLYKLDSSISVKGHIESLEDDLKFCLLSKYKLENHITW